MAGRRKKGTGFWKLIENFQGDKIMWMIVLILIMISIVAVSSSTPLLALQQHSTRNAIMREQMIISGLGILIIVALYNIRKIGIFRLFSQLGFFISFVMLFSLVINIKLPFMKAVNINGATRALSIFGFQLHVFEFVKILMIMYLSWAVYAFNNDSLSLANALSEIPRLSFLKKPSAKKWMYIYIPILVTCLLLMAGSMSSAIFIGGIMVLTILVGGIGIRELVPLGIGGVVLLLLAVGIYNASGGKHFKRIGTAMARVTRFHQDPEEELLKYKKGSIDFQDVLDKVRQPISAKVAVSEGGFFGKGPGHSTQRYIVPVMFEDYMFSFIVEEYGLFGAIIVLILYCSILARGSMISRSCENIYAKTVVAGLSMLISLQAIMHCLINVDLGPMTGQTLPMISHGNSSFLAFSIAFGIILSISRMAKTQMEKLARNASPIVEQKKEDEVRDTISDVETLDNL